MAATDVEVCNLALVKIGQREFITDLGENTVSAQVCSAVYSTTRDALTECFAWPFAKRRVTLAALSGVTRQGWGYVFALPADCLKPVSIYAGTRNPSSDNKVPFAVEYESTISAPVLLSDYATPELLYIMRVTAVPQMTLAFQQALAWQLAVELCLALPDKAALAERIQGKATQALHNAIAVSLNQEQADRPPESQFVTTR